MTTKPTVFVVDDDLSVREGLRNLLRSAGFEVETFDCASTFLEHRHPDQHGCLVLDMRMPGMSGIELQEQLTAISDGIPIVFITAHGDIPMTVRAMKAGAIEFLPKPFEEQALLDAIEQGLQLDAERRQARAIQDQLEQLFSSLTGREQQVLQLTIRGLMNKQIAGELGIAEVTVKVHRHNIMQKLNVRSLANLVHLVEKYESFERKG
ncbi:putative two-component response regulator (plasmid) [Pseudomonas putida S12]|uniref:Response regulator protein TodT n=1 Tax=Pseudomonas putida S12 TaxID=1215087 RepID=A0AA34S187_PSEPU|nr:MULTISPECIES: response regulator transcription factor [Pseudomonas]AAC23717.1 transcriptional activator [Pseudomonas sp. VLB120]AGZ38047.1 two-component response regulator [Pseudomonas sp. VLB120]AJA17112.1 putative two-component response regulator [Pseudomonas putida S12]